MNGLSASNVAESPVFSSSSRSPTRRRSEPGQRRSVPRSAHVRLAGVGVARAEGPVPEFHHIGRLRARHHQCMARRSWLVHRGMSVDRRTSISCPVATSTRVGSPIPEAVAQSQERRDTGIRRPCSTLTSMRRLTPERCASSSSVQSCSCCFERACANSGSKIIYVGLPGTAHRVHNSALTGQ